MTADRQFQPHRIVFILPCCIGDVVLATATLQAIRNAWPEASITWAISSWARPVIEAHPLVTDILDTGLGALPTSTPRGIVRFAGMLRARQFDLAVSLVRSPTMSVAVALSGIPVRAGLNSGGRGLGYNMRAPINPDEPRHEADIYLDVARVLGLDISGVAPTIPVLEADRQTVQQRLDSHDVDRYLVVNPAGGQNPGMTLAIKRYPPKQMAELAGKLAEDLRALVVLLGGPGDHALLAEVAAAMDRPPVRSFAGDLTFGQMAALAHDSVLYLGNDTGLSHLAAATGARTAMIFGPTDPARYGPYNEEAIALWRPSRVARRGVAAGAPEAFDWVRDGISVDDAEAAIYQFLNP